MEQRVNMGKSFKTDKWKKFNTNNKKSNKQKHLGNKQLRHLKDSYFLDDVINTNFENTSTDQSGDSLDSRFD